MAIKYYWEDFRPEQVFEIGSRTLTAREIIGFAREYDPQYYHTDEQAAKNSPFGCLIASGWHTVSIGMRLMCDGYLLETSCAGSPGIDELKWTQPVRPGDTLSFRSTVLAASPSRSKPDRGSVKFRWEVLNQNGEVVCSMIGTQIYLRRPAAS